MSVDDTPSHGIPEPEGAASVIETEYEIGQDNIDSSIGPFGFDVHNPVFAISSLSIVAFVLIALALHDQAELVFNGLRNWLTAALDWFFLSAANVFVLFCLFLIVSPLGKVRIGGREAEPDYSYTGWFAMLFAAGMGIGLMFFGVSEPISHFNSSLGGTVFENGIRTDWAPLLGAVGDEAAAARLGMAATIFH
ncbi:MAG: BCCT family transporter, partial [Gammaproteobacteria bacterium]|nr:BCCT family transporter [Gammaproteobacteria bacterium]